VNVVLDAIVAVFLDSAPYLLLGFALAGLTKVFLGEAPWLVRTLGRRGPRSVALAAIFGAPLPLCSCSVLPAAIALRRQGATKGATSSFLVSVPETDAVSVVLTWGLLGPLMAVVRPVAALCSALAAGLAVDAVDAQEREMTDSSAPRDATSSAPDCCAPVTNSAPRPWWRRALAFGFVEFFDDISAPLLFGLVIAGLVAAAAPALQDWSVLQAPWVWYVFALSIGVPTYVCATASTPVAVGMFMAGMSPGAVLVFLLVGPAISAASLAVLGREFGRRALGAHLIALICVALLFGLGLDHFFGATAVRIGAAVGAEREPELLGRVAAIVLVVLVLASARRKRWVGRSVQRFTRGPQRERD
jgi:uncharacterized protein